MSADKKVDEIILAIKLLDEKLSDPNLLALVVEKILESKSENKWDQSKSLAESLIEVLRNSTRRNVIITYEVLFY